MFMAETSDGKECLKTAIAIVSSQFSRKCCFWGSKGGMCAPEATEWGRLWLLIFLASSELSIAWNSPQSFSLAGSTSDAFSHHIASSLPYSGPRLPMVLLCCGTSLPDSFCTWVNSFMRKYHGRRGGCSERLAKSHWTIDPWRLLVATA